MSHLTIDLIVRASGKNIKLRNLLNLYSLLFSVAIFLLIVIPLSAQTNIYTDFASFDADTGQLTELDFETLSSGSVISSPLTLNGITFSSSFGIGTGFCSSPTCQPDPDNSSGGNIVLFLNVGGTIDFPARTGGVMLAIEGVGDVPYTVKVTDFGGNTITANDQGVVFETDYLGFTSASGIQRIEVVSTGPTAGCLQSPCGPLALSALFVELNDPDVSLNVWSDPIGDMSESGGDIIYGSAYVYDGMVDLRVQFSTPPFSTTDPQQITWCLDIDQDSATGGACLGSSSGADQSFTLIGTPNSLSGGDFSFSGYLTSLDPCVVGSFNWDTNILRLVIPASSLGDEGIFNYAVQSELGSHPGDIEQAPNSVDFSKTGQFFTSEAGEFAFSGSPLCSFNRDTSLTVTPQQTGYTLLYPELGAINANPRGGIQSVYSKSTAINREFRRGIFELTLPEIEKSIVKATLVYQSQLEFPYTVPRPTTTYEVSYYQPADLMITVDDHDRTATFLGPVQTDANWPQQSFALDITDLVKQSHGSTLGFRIKLAQDPDYNEIGNLGWTFGGFQDRPPQIEVQFVDAQTTISPTMESTLVYTDSQGEVTSVVVPANTVTETTELLYTSNTNSAGPSANNLSQSTITKTFVKMVGQAFTLNGYRDGLFTPGSILQQSITVTVSYADTDVAGYNEETLTLNYCDGSQWVHAACGQYERHLDENWLAVPVCELNEFALFIEKILVLDRQTYLPIVLKKN